MIYILGLIAGLVHKCKECQKSHCLSLAGAPEPSQLKEQGGAHISTAWEITFIALPWPGTPGEGRRHPKGLLPTTWRKALIMGEQDLLGGTGQHESGLGLQRSPGEAPYIFLFL